MRWLALVFCLIAGTAIAIEPDEVLEDPALEARARDLSQGLRCPVCQNESIDESRVPVAKDLRLLVRERLLAGDSDDEVLAYVVARYGEFVLLQPNTGGANLLLWGIGPAALILALGGFVFARRSRATEEPLSDAEEARLKALLEDD
ncbi:MAG: cytochrome c-type biogenesis protein CcmH [Rhodobacteraceae bacterium]|nr:cytochrome c-type biogenesis protein CcmH [Paracoccaceae bacterium]